MDFERVEASVLENRKQCIVFVICKGNGLWSIFGGMDSGESEEN